jgi:hypothetical protein
MKKMLVAAASLIVGAMLCVSAASAAPSGGSSLQLVVLGQASVAGAAASTQAHYGNQVTFNVKSSASQPWVSVACYQNGLAVYGQYWGFWSGYSVDAITNAMAVGGVFTLGPTALWSSGAASCTAKLSTFSKTGKESVLSTLPFTVAA